MSQSLVIGAGPAGLMAADILASAGHQVTIADQMPSVGRKFLMAGKSGLNLTKVEPMDAFLAAFGEVPQAFEAAVSSFGPREIQEWAEALGQEVFTGSTGRVFPKAMKASPLLRAWLARLDRLGVTLQRRWRWTGWAGDAAVFDTPTSTQHIKTNATVLALGGKSWARLGSDGLWAKNFPDITPFEPANCGFQVKWSDFMTPFFGTPMKATALRADDRVSRGEWVITRSGIEGGGVYEISAALRHTGRLEIDLLPDLNHETIIARLQDKAKTTSRQKLLRHVLRLSPAKMALFNELARDTPLTKPAEATTRLKALPLRPTGPFPIDGAISTAGGLPFAAIDQTFMLRARPGVFVAGEMLDWEAPTGGYLITGCLASGRAAGHAAANWIARSN
ncbi:MAG: TIGR03862 family flavoprotein [Pseudomonadota bacterium]